MARFYGPLAAILLIWGCSGKHEPPDTPTLLPVPAQLPPVLWLKPGRFMEGNPTSDSWMLVPGQRQILDLPDLDDYLGRGLTRWYTLFRGSEPRYLFAERLNGFSGFTIDVHLLRKDVASLKVAQIPLANKAGATWDSIRQRSSSDQDSSSDVIHEKGSCVQEGDTLRVDFKEGELLSQSMRFTRMDGLICWKGASVGELTRVAGSEEEVALWSAAMSYRRYGRVNDDLLWAPEMCRGPVIPPLRLSHSGDASTHGRKLYHLFAKERLAYLRLGELDQPDGQVVVKETWIPPGKKAKGPLFLMLKSGGKWTYATASPDGSTITSYGQIASCIECHESTRTRDRLFGLQPSQGTPNEEVWVSND